MSQFRQYGKYYDLFNQGKEYAAEAEYVLSVVQENSPAATAVLELGCGTGGHAFPLAERGCKVTGIDVSEEMIDRANRRMATRPQDTAALQFRVGDVRDFRAERTFDCVLSLFHVVNYQTSDSDLAAAFRTARTHLETGAMFVFDSWYGPAVVADPPYERTRTFTHEEFTGKRTATPILNESTNVVELNLVFEVRNAEDQLVEQFTERHAMRFLFTDEISEFLRQAGFELRNCWKWMSREPANDRSWYATYTAVAI